METKFGRGKQAGAKAKKEPADEGKAKKRKTEAKGVEQSNKRGKSSSGDAGKSKKGSAKAGSSSSKPSSSSSAAILEDVRAWEGYRHAFSAGELGFVVFFPLEWNGSSFRHQF